MYSHQNAARAKWIFIDFSWSVICLYSNLYIGINVLFQWYRNQEKKCHLLLFCSSSSNQMFCLFSLRIKLCDVLLALNSQSKKMKIKVNTMESAHHVKHTLQQWLLHALVIMHSFPNFIFIFMPFNWRIRFCERKICLIVFPFDFLLFVVILMKDRRYFRFFDVLFSK